MFLIKAFLVGAVIMGIVGVGCKAAVASILDVDDFRGEYGGCGGRGRWIERDDANIRCPRWDDYRDNSTVNENEDWDYPPWCPVNNTN